MRRLWWQSWRASGTPRTHARAVVCTCGHRVLRPSFLEASKRAGVFVDEAAHSWSAAPPLAAEKEERLRRAVAHYARPNARSALQDERVFLRAAPERQASYTSILSAAGAIVLTSLSGVEREVRGRS